MSASRDRLQELLADRALVGLGAREQIELAELLVQAQDVDIAAFDRAAAAISLASVAPHLEPMPADLAARLEQSGLAALEARAPSTPARPASDFATTRAVPNQHTLAMDDRPVASASLAPPPPPRARGEVVPFPAPRGPSRALAIGGWVAAAACLLLAIGAFALRAPRAPVVTLPVTPPSTSSPLVTPAPPASVAEVTPAQLREQLLAARGTARAEWTATKDPLGKATTGEVVWNKDQQKGTMRFVGLAKNDPTRAQYQLWIFDKARDEKYPVDGGVFDVGAETGDVVVPIRATLPVNAPVLFAITLEKPGGVVVSKRERIVVTAKLPAG